MQHPDEGMIHTWLDGELPAEEAGALEAHVADCAQCAGAVAEARGLIAGSSRIVSALDSVPAGVIPLTRPAHRAWYSTTQFRAAAAFLLVAGTSLLVVKKNETKGDRIMAVAAPRVPAADATSRESATTPVAQKVAAAKPGLQQKPSAASSNSAMAAAARAPVAAESRQAEPTVVYRPSPSVAGAAQMALKSGASRAVAQDSAATDAVADDLTVAGVALRLIRADTTRGVTQSVFEMRNGIQLILTERSGAAFQPLSAKTPSVLSQAPAMRNAPMAAAPRAKDQIKLADYRTIIWVDAATGRIYSLTGPLTEAELEKLKTEIVKLSQ